MHRRQFAGALLALPNLLKAADYAPDQGDDAAARDHFFQPDRWAGIRVSILLRREVPGKPCQLREVPSNEVLRTGDRIQLRIQPNAGGYLYVLTEDQEGNHRLLYPTLDDAKGTNSAAAFQVLAVPQVDWLRFDDQPGIDPVVVVFGRQPVAKLEALRSKDATLSARDFRRLIAAQSGDLQQREVEESRNGSIPAIFSVAQFDNDDDLMTERIELTHRPARKRG